MQNQTYNSLGSVGSGGGGRVTSTPSPLASSRRFPRMMRRSWKGESGRRFTPAPRTLIQRSALAVLSMLLRRQAIFLFGPLFYVGEILFYIGIVSLDSVPAIIPRSPAGSVYRIPQLYVRLRLDMDYDNSTYGVKKEEWTLKKGWAI